MFRSFFISILLALSFINVVHSFAFPAGTGVVEVVDPAAAPEAPEVPAAPAPVDANADGDAPRELIGDLLTGITTPTGQSIANILLGSEDGESDVPGTPPANGGLSGCTSSTDECCIWYSISADLTRDFKDRTGRCNDMARAAIRLGFHDAGTWSKRLAAAGQDFGGADGSLVLFDEISRSENRGLEGIVSFAEAYYKKYGVGMADLIQYMATHAVVTCPLGPRVRTYVGRKDATRAAPDGLLPSVSSNADTLIALFEDKTISAHDMTALIGAHSTSKQFTVSAAQFGKAQDSTPGVWDVSFYNETLQPGPKPNPHPKTFRFASDSVISKDPRTRGEWLRFVGDQNHWNGDYAKAYVRLSLLGVKTINTLTECTATLPAAVKTFQGSSAGLVNQRKRSEGEREGPAPWTMVKEKKMRKPKWAGGRLIF